MQRRIATLSRVIEKEFGVSLSIGVGIHFGPVIVGQVGPADDLRFGLVGDCVNIASRLEGKTKEPGVPILISSAVREHLSSIHEGWQVGATHCLHLKGVREPFVLHALIPAADDSTPRQPRP